VFKIFKKNKLKNDKKFTENLTEKREEVQVIPAVPITPVIQRINLQQ
jgi:hypothetical protein